MIYGNRDSCDSGHPLANAKRLKTSTAPGGQLSIICNRCAMNRKGYMPPHPDAIHPDAIGRFWLNVRIIDDVDSCWEWLGSKNDLGYGQYGVAGRIRRAHRVAYCIDSGAAIPTNLELDHLCRNRGCVRPSHLEAVTHAVNVERARLSLASSSH